MKRYDCTDGGVVKSEYGTLVDYDDAANLLREALDAMLNLAPRYRDERGGCFGSGHDVPCLCTACKIKRELTT